MQVPSLLDSDNTLSNGMSLSPRQSSLTLQLYVRYCGPTDLRDVTLSLSAPSGLQLDQVRFVFASIFGLSLNSLTGAQSLCPCH